MWCVLAVFNFLGKILGFGLVWCQTIHPVVLKAQSWICHAQALNPGQPYARLGPTLLAVLSLWPFLEIFMKGFLGKGESCSENRGHSVGNPEP